ncbi:MAG: MerR family transcriptional regulator [Candidatus Dormibacteria bacterium]
MRTAQVAAEAGVNAETLRYYERRGLLPEPERLDSGYRAYGPDAVRMVRFIKRAQQLGFSLEEIEPLLDLAGGGPTSCDEARILANEKIAHLEDKISGLCAMRDSLRQLVATCSFPRPRRECPLLDAIEGGASLLGKSDAG